MDMSEARCSNGVPGVEADNVCCGPQCVTCGGPGCSQRPGGEVRCCLSMSLSFRCYHMGHKNRYGCSLTRLALLLAGGSRGIAGQRTPAHSVEGMSDLNTN